jgi:hypothetical protein
VAFLVACRKSRKLDILNSEKVVDNVKIFVPSIFKNSMSLLRRIPLGPTLISIGGLLTLIGFGAYAVDNSTLNLIGFFYGVPLLLGGLALKSAELRPVPLDDPEDEMLALRQQQETPILKQIRQDVTRFRYGQEAHLDLALEKLGLSPTDEERPVIRKLREAEINGQYALILEFYTPLISIDTWHEKQDKITRFFGPGIHTTITPTSDEDLDLALIVGEPAKVEA